MNEIKVVAAVVRRGGEILICDRPADKPPAGWEFPGGKVEPGETLAQAVRRELREELDYEVQCFDCLYEEFIEKKAKNQVIHLYFMRCRDLGKTPQPCEHQHCKWVPLTKLHTAGLLPGDANFAEFLQQIG